MFFKWAQLFWARPVFQHINTDFKSIDCILKFLFLIIHVLLCPRVCLCSFSGKFVSQVVTNPVFEVPFYTSLSPGSVGFGLDDNGPLFQEFPRACEGSVAFDCSFCSIACFFDHTVTIDLHCGARVVFPIGSRIVTHTCSDAAAACLKYPGNGLQQALASSMLSSI
jgi:hypothetical protein